MDLPTSESAALSLDELERALSRAGASLRGKNLRKASWREIAAALSGSQRVATLVQQRLRAARTREDALRVLRMVRRSRQRKRRGTARAASSRALASTSGPIKTVSDVSDSDEHDEFWSYRDPWVACASHWSCCGTVDAEERILYAGEWIVDALAARVFPFKTLSKLTGDPQQPTATRRPTADDAPIELRLSRHFQAALGALSDPSFLARMREAVGSSRNLEVIRAVAAQHELPGLAARICLFAPFWLREPRSWSGEGRLVDQLFVRRAPPSYLYTEWLLPCPRIKWLTWFVLLGFGASLHRAARQFPWRIAKRFQRYLESAPEGLTPLEGTMYSEVIRLGGSEVDFRRLANNRAYVVDRTEHSDRPSYDRFWGETARWLITNRDALDDEEAARVLDWAMHEHTEEPNGARRFSWKGRSARASLERANEYRELLARRRSPFANARWDPHGWDRELDEWAFVELSSSAELLVEGRALHHCVAGYAHRCAAGYSAIVSLRREGERRVTIELNPGSRVIVQARGLQNRVTTPEERRVIERWLRETVRRDRLS